MFKLGFQCLFFNKNGMYSYDQFWFVQAVCFKGHYIIQILRLV